jgi:hypothetical protein
MWLLFIPLAVLLVVLIVVVGTAVAIFAAAHAVPWLLILAGLWLVLSAGRGRGVRRWATAPAPPPRPWPRPTPMRTVKNQPQPTAPTSPPRPQPRPGRELPIDVQIKVEQIRRKADMLLGYADRFPPFSHDLHIVRQTAADYLPRTIAAYLALPGDGDPVVAPTGKTALQELREQLQLLDAKLDDIAQDLQRQDLDRLLANRRFLEERFRPRDRDDRPDQPDRESDAA